MRLSSGFCFFIILLYSTNNFAQDTIRAKVPDTISNWKTKNKLAIDISEIAFLNWSAGGSSAVTGLIKGHFHRDYNNNNMVWKNELLFRYGLNKQEGTELRKTDDVFRINSTFGYRKDTLSDWYHSAQFNFNTQFTAGYNYPNTTAAISKPFAPAYTFLGIGSEYINKEKKFTFYASPLTLKNTLVLDQTLANIGAFGVTKAVYDAQGNIITEGKTSRTELGILLTSYIEKEVYKNINIKTRLSLYTDYINNFGNIDVDWQFQMDLIVNEYVNANIGFNLIYDDDVDSVEEINGAPVNVGPKIQLKQVLGIGLVYDF